MKRFTAGVHVVIAAAALAGFSVLGLAQDADVTAIVEGRQSNLRDLGAAFKGIDDELKKSSPVVGVITQYSRQIDELAKQQHFWFPTGSGPQPDVKTKAKAEIWTRPDLFSEAQADFTREAALLVQVTATGDMAAIKTQQRAVGKTCAACHKQFREKLDD